jgi:arsenite methyltransferase
MNRTIGIIVIIIMGQLLSVIGLAGAVSKDGGITSHSSYPTAYEEDPRRLEWQKSDKVLDHLLIKQGDVIADIGAGTGYFSLLFAQRVGNKGLVYAVDIDENMVTYLANRSKKEGLDNIKTILASPNDPLLPKLSADLIFIGDTYMFIENREQYLIRVRESLKNSGHLAIISFNRKAEISGAPPLHLMISREKTKQEAEKAGFVLEAEYFFLPYQDFMVFVKR